MTTTPNLGMTLPVVGSDTNVWGGYLNSDLTILDNIFPTAGNGTSVGLNIGTGKTLTVAGTLNATGTVTLPTDTTFNNPTTYTISSISGTGGVGGFATATFTPNDLIPVGTVITITGTTSYNGPQTVVSSSVGTTNATLTFSSSASASESGYFTFPLTIVSTTGGQTLYTKTLQDPVLNGSVTGTYSLGGTPTLTGALTSTANITFKKQAPILALNTSSLTYGYRFWAQINDGTPGSDNGLAFQQYSSTWRTVMTINPNLGVTVGSPTGGDKGPGTINAQGLYINGGLVPLNNTYKSNATAMAVNSTLTFNHGLGVVPEFVVYTLTCTSADAGYAVNDQIQIPVSYAGILNNLSYGYTTEVSATYIKFKIVNGVGPMIVVNKNTTGSTAGDLTGLAINKWTLVVQAYV